MHCYQILAFALLLSTVYSYTLLGPWRLQVDSSFTNITANASIVFDFSKNINNDSTISNYVSVLACQVIDFKYNIDESQIYFNLAKVGISRRDCIKDEVSEIIGKLQKVNFMSTINNMLLFLTASGKILLKLTKVDTDKYTNSVSGIWESYEIDSQPTSVISKANNTVLQLCGGVGLVDYYIPNTNAIDFKIRSTKGCSESDFFTALYKTSYFRNFNEDLWLYNSEVELVMKMKNLADLPGNQTIPWPVIPQAAAQQAPDNSSTKSVIGNTIIGQSNTQNGSSIVSTVKIVPTLSVKSSDTLSASPAPVSTPVASTTTKPASPPISPAVSYSTTIKKEDILGKWFLIGAATEIMMVIVNSRIMVYGDCGVWFSLFNYKPPDAGKVPIFSIRIQNTLPTCLGKSNPLESSLSTLAYMTIK